LIGIAYDLAKAGHRFDSKEGLQMAHYIAERHAYHLIKASIKLGRERGNAAWMHKTRWPEGWLPVDTYNENVDEGMDFIYHFDWEELRGELIANKGMRFSALCSHMPTESCLVSDTRVQTREGSMSLREILERAGVTLEQAELDKEPLIGGKWYELSEPIEVNTRFGYKSARRVWYNGQTPHFKLTMADGSVIKCTFNHRFLVRRDGGVEQWVKASDLQEGDDIVQVK
jgi:hypothetical protein